MTHIHFIGIGGAGMSGIARLWAELGHVVSGSDGLDSATLDQLRAAGITTWIGHDASHLVGVDEVVVSTAIRADNPELIEARNLGLPILHRSQALAALATKHDVIAVAGTHGKTTTSAMITTILLQLGLDPSYVIGGQIIGSDGAHSSAALDSGSAFVIEADESDGSFVNYDPAIAVVTNLEPDHLDYYGDEASYRMAFRDFARRIRGDGALIACADDAGALQLADELKDAGHAVFTYGRSSDADLRICALHFEGDASAIELSWRGQHHSVQLGVPGEHNAMNAAGAVLAVLAFASRTQELSLATVGDAVTAFQGTRRRFESVGAVRNIRVVDDYAHHPTEVAAALRTGRIAAAEGRLIAVFQPHLFSRTRAFAAEFAESLALADDVVVTAIYPAREDPIPGVTSHLIVDGIDEAAMGPMLERAGTVRYAGSLDDAAAIVAALARPGDLVLTIGAGTVTTVGPKLLSMLLEST